VRGDLIQNLHSILRLLINQRLGIIKSNAIGVLWKRSCDMKLTTIISSALALVLLALPSPSLAQSQAQRSSPSLFQSGRIRLVEEVRVSDKDLPENALFQNPRGVE
jgi:hypothetical protein